MEGKLPQFHTRKAYALVVSLFISICFSACSDVRQKGLSIEISNTSLKDQIEEYAEYLRTPFFEYNLFLLERELNGEDEIYTLSLLSNLYQTEKPNILCLIYLDNGICVAYKDKTQNLIGMSMKTVALKLRDIYPDFWRQYNLYVQDLENNPDIHLLHVLDDSESFILRFRNGELISKEVKVL